MAHSHSIADNKGQLAGIVGLSALVGALAGILFTPRAGSSTRAQIRQRTADMKHKMQAKRLEMLNRTSDKVDDTQQTLIEGTDKTKQKIDQQADKAKKPEQHNQADHIRRHGEP